MFPNLRGTALPPDIIHDGIEWQDETPAAPARPREYLKRGDLLRYLAKCTARWLRMEKRILRRKVHNAREEQRQREIREAKESIGW